MAQRSTDLPAIEAEIERARLDIQDNGRVPAQEHGHVTRLR